MEYLEGDTLAQRLEKGALPLDQALTVAIEIADALDKAHRQGITHRDLKPGNIMLTTAGAKLLDFGLAKLRQLGTAGAEGFSTATTQDSPLTARGTLLGTLPYMAPEQLEGKDADARTDLFAFGAVVYEMVTGTRAFGGETQASLITAIMSSDPPPVASLQPLTPAAVNRLVGKCLAKDPDRRWQTATDLADELAWIAERDSRAAASVVDTRRAVRGRLVPSVVTGVIAAVVAAVAVWGVLRPGTPPPSLARFTITLPEDERLLLAPIDFGPPLAISPDGSHLVYAVRHPRRPVQLYIRALDQFEASPLPGTEGARAPFFSPDGRWVGFHAASEQELRKVAVAGGEPVTLGIAPAASAGGSWGTDDTIIFEAGVPSVLYRVSVSR